ncbi:MAG: ABC transporter ATP-binding protein [Archangiaceae bacterium]|nr:ABC transporter ATP-binding protein [Archangiaceae bacterium]
MSVLSLEHVSVRYPGAGRDVVKDVSLSVDAGQVLGIVGESGSGKSTLLKAWLGLVPVTAGVVAWSGTDLSTLSSRELATRRSAVQPVFQDPGAALNPRLQIRASLAEPFEIHSRPVSEAELVRLLSEVQLGAEVLERRPHELSAGMKQRVALARALALNPSTLVLDEPVSALDVSVQAQVIELLTTLRTKRQLNLVLVSHDLGVIRALSTHVAVLFAGRVVEQGTLEEVFRAPLHPYTQSLVSDAVKPLVDRPIAPEPGCSFRARCPFATDACHFTPRLEPRGHLVACVRSA